MIVPLSSYKYFVFHERIHFALGHFPPGNAIHHVLGMHGRVVENIEGLKKAIQVDADEDGHTGKDDEHQFICTKPPWYAVVDDLL